MFPHYFSTSKESNWKFQEFCMFQLLIYVSFLNTFFTVSILIANEVHFNYDKTPINNDIFVIFHKSYLNHYNNINSKVHFFIGRNTSSLSKRRSLKLKIHFYKCLQCKLPVTLFPAKEMYMCERHNCMS